MSAIAPFTAFQIPPYPVRRFTVHEYHQMIKKGVLAEDESVELLHGWIVPKMSRRPPHDAILDILAEKLRALVPADAYRVRVQSAITTADSEPEPDLAIVLGSANRYFTRHPGQGEIAMIVEVADSSIERDRTEKGPIYAAVNVPSYWIVNIPGQVIEVRSDPRPAGYQSCAVFGVAEEIAVAIDGRILGVLSVREILTGG